jgi:hypothetical protein
MPRPWLLALAALAALALAACASIPKGRYGVDELKLEGTKQIDPYALRACLATQEREWLSINLSKEPAPTCGEPPFDARRLHLGMWRWPWTEWPLYDPSIFERDLSRIERWYRARGYYGVRILDVRSTPEIALYGTQSETNKIALSVSIDEGQPVLIQSVTIAGADALSFELRRELDKIAKELPAGQRFDEADYDLTRERLLRTLRDEGYAAAAVDGKVEVDPKAKSAQIAFQVESGPLMEVGDVCVEGFGKLPAKLILQASDLRPGRPFSQSDIEDARTRVYQLRVLSEVEIIAGSVDPKTGASRFDDETREGEWLAWKNGQGGASGDQVDPDAGDSVRVCRLAKQRQGKRPRVPIEIRVKPGKLYRFGVGAGLQIGVEDGQRAVSAAQQWDVHVFAYAEVQNFLGGLRRLRIEERPKLIFTAPFPRLEDSEGRRDIKFGNNLSVLLEWPAFLEARTMLRFVASWDRGPDPYGGKFIRDDFNFGLGPSRGFLKNRLNASVMVYLNPYIPRELYGTTTDSGMTSVLKDERYDLLFLQQVIDWDTRDDKVSPRRGTYARVELQETLPPSSWGYVRVAPELRQYIALPYGLVLAGRAGIGWLGIYNTDARTEELRRLGPRPYRLRGGGPYSVRGIQAGELGMRNEHDGYFPGGTRSWIASLELRIPLGDSFGVATFVDVGDVDGGSSSEAARFRFNHPNTTLGAGLRYKTLVGPIRLDVGFLVPGLQGPLDDSEDVDYKDPLFQFAGAVHLTVGEAF